MRRTRTRLRRSSPSPFWERAASSRRRASYFAAIQPILKRYDILLIADEVITGFGRTGRMFGSELYGLEPDLVTLAKGLTSAYVPFSASVVSEGV